MKHRHYSDIIAGTVAFIENMLKQGKADILTLDAIAGRVGYSKYHLGRLFQQETGVTIHQYIIKRRLSGAAQELVRTRRPIADIGYEAGYQSQQAFTDAFSRVYTVSPKQYRMAGAVTTARGKMVILCGFSAAGWMRGGEAA